MKISRSISTVEVHASGAPFRIVTNGLPRAKGSTVMQRRAWMKENADDIRRALMFEPRGHADMYGGYLTDPVSPSADFGVIFVHNEGYSDHSEHGVIALATVAVELGWVERTVNTPTSSVVSKQTRACYGTVITSRFPFVGCITGIH